MTGKLNEKKKKKHDAILNHETEEEDSLVTDFQIACLSKGHGIKGQTILHTTNAHAQSTFTQNFSYTFNLNIIWCIPISDEILLLLANNVYKD